MSQSLRVLHVDTGREWRGGQGQVLTLCKGLRESGVEQLLAAPPGSPLAARAREAGVAVAETRMRGEFDYFGARRLRRHIDALGATIVHAHDAHAHSVAWMAARRRPDARLVVSRRVDFDISKNFLSRRKYLDPRARFFAISNGVREALERGGVAPDRIAVVPSGVDPERFTFDVPASRLREEFHISPDAPVIGTIGSLVDHKHHLCMVEAAACVLERMPDARFFIVGEGELRPALERRIVELGLERAVTLTGYREDIETFLSGFDVFALSSHLEGLCTSVADAMLFRLPVAATRTGGVPDLVVDGETGLLVEPKQPEMLARAILRLIEEPDLAKRLGENAEAHVRKDFTARALLRNTLRAYGDVLNLSTVNKQERAGI